MVTMLPFFLGKVIMLPKAQVSKNVKKIKSYCCVGWGPRL